MKQHLPENLLDRIIAEAQADDYALVDKPAGSRSLRSMSVTVSVFVLIGFLFAAASWQRQTVQPEAQDRRQELIDRIDRATQSAEAEQAAAVELRASVSQLQQLATSGLGEGFAEQLQAVQIASGFVGLTGPGATVTMQDAVPPLPKGFNPTRPECWTSTFRWSSMACGSPGPRP